MIAFSFESSSHVGGNDNETPKELLSFIEKQENYIDQLEKESNYCRVSGEENFHEKSSNKNKTSKTLFDTFIAYSQTLG